MKIIFDALAKKEYDDAIEYYNLEIAGLGSKFDEEIKIGLDNIKKYPEIGSKVKGDVRKYIINKFPYKILYSIEDGYIYILAIAHNHRKPNYWIERDEI